MSIYSETPLVPVAAADAVIEEVEQYLGRSVPDARGLAADIAEDAEMHFETNARFRRRIQGRSGRDALYAFMRHWTAARLRQTTPALFRRLPASFANGEPLPRRG